MIEQVCLSVEYTCLGCMVGLVTVGDLGTKESVTRADLSPEGFSLMFKSEVKVFLSASVLISTRSSWCPLHQAEMVCLRFLVAHLYLNFDLPDCWQLVVLLLYKIKLILL